jgi:hypothetical protein
VGDRLERELSVRIDVARGVVGEGLSPAPGVIVSDSAVERAACMKLVAEQPNTALDATAAGVEPVTQECRTWFSGVRLLLGMHVNPLYLQLRGHGLVGLVGAVAQERTFEWCLQEGIQAVHIMAIAGDGKHERNAPLRSEDEVFADTVEVHLERGAVPSRGQAIEPLAAFGAHELADVNGV